MNCSYAYVGVLAALTLSGCTINNPLFEVSSGSTAPAGASTGEGSTDVAPTSDPLTSTSEPGTSVSATSASETSVSETSTPGTSQTATSVEPETGTTDMVVETGTSTGEPLPMVCGDGVLDMGEECDDGNVLPGDGCSAACTNVVEGCGNQVLDVNEQCDDGPGNGPGKACLGTCQKNICGDGDQGPGEECDLGDQNDNAGTCTIACTKAYCGDGILNNGEACDNGDSNGQFLGVCNEACSGIVPMDKLKIKVLAGVTGNFGGIGGGDKLCGLQIGANYKVMAADGATRIASLGPNEGGSNKWVLFPHRGYADANGVLIFITGKEALLGVRKKLTVPLIQPIGGALAVWTGMNATWQTSAADCGDWGDLQVTGAVGNSSVKDGGAFIGSGGKNCTELLAIYCVQQPL